MYEPGSTAPPRPLDDLSPRSDITDSAAMTARPGEIVESGITPALTLLFAASVGIIITNLSAPQTLIGPIGRALGMPAETSSLVAVAPLLGYAAGLFFLVPLADLLENKRLIVGMLAAAALTAASVSLVPNATALLGVLFVLGAACSAIQMLVPIAAGMATAARRGRVIGNVMSGLMLGLLLSRPLASLAAHGLGWRAFFVASGVTMTALAATLAWRLPRRRPTAQLGYGALIVSLWQLLRDEPELRHRAMLAALGMAAFTLFWTTVALRLALPPFSLDQGGIAVFALMGAGGVAATPFAGRVGDRGWTRPASIAAHLLIIAAFALAGVAGAATEPVGMPTHLALLAGAAFVLDIGVIGDQTLGRRAINLLQPEARGRLNALFVGLFFVGGSVGSAVAGVAWATGGWSLVCLIGAGFGVVALVIGRVRQSA